MNRHLHDIGHISACHGNQELTCCVVSLPTATQPDITFFGEKLDDVFDRSLLEDRGQVDLLIIIGTSLKVSPVSETICKSCLRPHGRHPI